jgi:hypothetical protein
MIAVAEMVRLTEGYGVYGAVGDVGFVVPGGA